MLLSSPHQVTLLVQVNELTMQNEYQLRLKDLAMNEKVKELTEKFTAELDVDKTKFDSLLQEKNEQELEFEEKGKQVEEKHQVQYIQYIHPLAGQTLFSSHLYCCCCCCCCCCNHYVVLVHALVHVSVVWLRAAHLAMPLLPGANIEAFIKGACACH